MMGQPCSNLLQTLTLCKQKGLRMTSLRKRVLGLIMQSTRPLSAYALVALYKETEGSVTATTIYRTLDFLEEYGLIHRVVTKNAYIRCIMPGHSVYGQFLICQKCHRVLEMHDDAVTKAIDTCTERKHFLSQGQMVEVWGLCQGCEILQS
jgi:Fur family transcriptional regulator, zinc uptake regulator